jgi:hypothetical protein
MSKERKRRRRFLEEELRRAEEELRGAEERYRAARETEEAARGVLRAAQGRYSRAAWEVQEDATPEDEREFRRLFPPGTWDRGEWRFYEGAGP